MTPLFFLLVIFASPAQGIPALEPGMSMKEVLTLSGPPDEKKVRESRRIEEWSFPAYTVVFKEGSLFSWTGMIEDQAKIETLPVVNPVVPSNMNQPSEEAAISPETSNIIEEILREVPSGADSNSPAGHASQPPSISNPIPPAVVNSGEPEMDDE